jgi:hypothetical protein
MALQFKGDEKVEITMAFLKQEMADTLGVFATPLALVGFLAEKAAHVLRPNRPRHLPVDQAAMPKPPAQGQT